nr:single-stranded-DNA-specific exonuclease RecJ [Actinomycetota bacterium]
MLPSLKPFSYASARRIATALELPEAVAVALVRRGHETVEEARRFLAADERHDAGAFDGIGAAVELIERAVEAGERITVHGDYDVDGTTSTAILVGALRELGADCDWLIPDRIADGYGVTTATISALERRGTRLLITADCGITSTGEVAAAKERGMAVIVTDHHQPGDELPDCPIVHPLVSGYPCRDLCAAGVAHKLVAALVGVERAERDLDLVALATVADMVPLLGENRSLVRRGIDHLRRARRPGLRALMAVASVAPDALAASDLSFRLAPRINAAGRLYRADAAVELFLTRDEARAASIAAELDRANHERRAAERECLADAERKLRELDADGDRRAAVVLWGEGWHPGVVGICASRIAERTLKPAILIALDADGRGKGSGRSVPGFDLLAGLHACRDSLARFGGHRAAAGLEIEAAALEPFRAAFCAHAAAALADHPAVRTEEVDSVVGVDGLGFEGASQLARLGPFGKGNPEPRLLVPAVTIADVRPMGEGARHARFALASHSARAPGVAFGVGDGVDSLAARGSCDVSVRLELNEWNGAVEPRVLLGEIYDPSTPARPISHWLASDREYAERLGAAMAAGAPGPLESTGLGAARERIRHRGASGVATVAALASSGEPVLVVCADALWRRRLVEVAADPRRFGGGALAIVASRGSFKRGAEAAERVLTGGRGGVALADWAALGKVTGLASRFAHVVIADPAPCRELEDLAAAGLPGDPKFMHTLDSALDPSLSLRALDLELPLRPILAQVFQAIAAGSRDLPGLRAALTGADAQPLSPEAAGLGLGTLAEIGVVALQGSGPDLVVQGVSSVRA